MEQQPQQPPKKHGERIGGIVRSTLQSGDLSRLKDLGLAIEDAAKDTLANVKLEARNVGTTPAVRQPQTPQAKPRHGQPVGQPYGQATSYGAPAAPWKGGAKKLSTTSKGMVRIVFGVMGLVGFGIAAIVMAILALTIGVTQVFVPLLVGFVAAALACWALMDSGLKTNRKAKLAASYSALFEHKPVYTVTEVAAATGKEPKKIRKEIKKLKKAGFLPDVRMDEDEMNLMCGAEAWQRYLDSKKTMTERAAEAAERERRMQDPATAPLEAFKKEGADTIQKIRAANAAIPGEAISGQLSTLENTCARIFGYVEKYPEKLPDTRKFMDYYLPTTLKLVEKYQQFEAMDYQPDNVKHAKGEIERSLDTINMAFKNMLESLYQHDTLDVTTDIEVLEKMLEQEGLTGNQFEIETGGKPDLTL